MIALVGGGLSVLEDMAVRSSKPRSWLEWAVMTGEWFWLIPNAGAVSPWAPCWRTWRTLLQSTRLGTVPLSQVTITDAPPCDC
jgi:hypothetical protein